MQLNRAYMYTTSKQTVILMLIFLKSADSSITCSHLLSMACYWKSERYMGTQLSLTGDLTGGNTTVL